MKIHAFIAKRVAGAGLGVLLGCGFWSAAPAEPPYYDVEILLFENLRGDSGEERWSQGANRNADDAFEADLRGDSVDMQGGRGIHPLQGPYELQAIYDAMRRSSLYRPVLLWRWRQPGWERGQALPIRLRLPDAGRDGQDLDGTVSVALSRYLHLTADLRLQEAGSGRTTTLRETRRMRSGELHYLDNPRFGLLTRITPHRGP